jgi:hypothetical protein
MKRGEGRSGNSRSAIAGAFAVLTGGVIAWVDTRPGWDDTGVTAGALLMVAGIGALSGLRWWIATALVVCPLLLAEFRSGGWGLLLAPVLSVVGAVVGALVRRIAAGGRVVTLLLTAFWAVSAGPPKDAMQERTNRPKLPCFSPDLSWVDMTRPRGRELEDGASWRLDRRPARLTADRTDNDIEELLVERVDARHQRRHVDPSPTVPSRDYRAEVKKPPC